MSHILGAAPLQRVGFAFESLAMPRYHLRGDRPTDRRKASSLDAALNSRRRLLSVTTEIEEASLACLDRFMDAVNAHDVLAMEQEMHFPHVRIAAGAITTYAAPGSNPLDLFSRLQRDDGWHRSRWISKEIVQGDDKKVHVAVQYTRMRKDGSIIGDYHSLYILTHQDGRWGVLARSSFGP